MMTKRNALNKFKFSESYNAGLWLDKFIEDATNDKEKRIKTDEDKPRPKLVRQVAAIEEPAIYKEFYENVWKANLKKVGAKCREAQVANRLVVNLGAESVLETSIALHRIYGVPFIPGSALKGLAAAFVRQYGGADWRKNKEQYITIFGDGDNAGFVTFYDALYLPNSGYKDKPLYADVMTTHHADYYGNKKEKNEAGEEKDVLPPADWDSPNPVSFLSATGKYLIALAAPEGCADWVNLTFDILGSALKHEGVGAKTSSGYGRMRFVDEKGRNAADEEPNETKQTETTEAKSQVLSPEEQRAQVLIARVNALRVNDVAGRIGSLAKEWETMPDDDYKKQVAQTIKQKVVEAKREKASAEKDWFKRIEIYAE